MERKVGQIITYKVTTLFKNTKRVQAEIIDIYPVIYGNESHKEMSIKYDDLGDTVIEHGIALNSPAIIE